jgi:hypothetical protein
MKSARSCRILQCGGGTLAILLAAACATHAASLFTTASPLPGVSARADGPYTVGNSFMVGSQPLVVSSLGAMDTSGSSPYLASDGFVGGSVQVGLWTGDGAILLASAAVASSDPIAANYRYHTLATPVTLSPNTTYLIGACVGAGIEWFLDASANAVATADAGITVAASRYATGGALAAPLTSGGLNAGRWAPANASFSTNAPPPPTPTSITNSLAGYWNFDETSGSTAADSSGNGNPGTVHNTFGDGGQWTAGKVGGALRFRGAGLGDDFVTVSNWSRSLNGAMSLSAWVLADTNQNDTLLGVVESSAQAVTSAQESAPLPPASWQHVVMVADGTNLLLYRNGTLAGSGSYDGTFYSPTNLLTLGARLTNGTSPDAVWQGKLDEVACWTRGLNANDVFELFAAGCNGNSVTFADSYSNSPPLFASQPQGGNFYPHDALSLVADAAGLGLLTYQWWKDGAPIANATNRTFANPGADLGASGQYAVVATDGNGHSVTSAPVTLSVSAPALSLVPAGAGLSLTWPAGAASYQLQFTPVLGSPWNAVPGLTTNLLLLGPINSAQFYRLFRN